MTVRLRAPRGFVNPGGRDYQAWLLAEGIDASGYVVGKAPHARLAARGCGAHLDRLRWSLRTRLAELVGNEPQFGKLLAVTIGDDSRFRPSDWEVFALTGTTHLMVISGMHITLVAMLALLGAKRVLRLWPGLHGRCLLYTSDAADDLLCVALGGRRILKKKRTKKKKKKKRILC